MDYNQKRFCIILFRDYAIIAVISMVVHLILLLIGVDSSFSRHYLALPIIPACCCIALSKMLHLCSVHRLSLAYVGIMTFLIQRREDYSWFMDYLLPIRIVMLVIGVALLVVTFKRLNLCYGPEDQSEC